MSFLRPKKAKSEVAKIEPQAVAARPTKVDTLQKDRDKRRAQLLRAGRAGTILTEGQTLGSSSVLGGGA